MLDDIDSLRVVQFYRGLKLNFLNLSGGICLRVVQFYRGLKPNSTASRSTRSLRVVQFYRGLKLLFRIDGVRTGLRVVQFYRGLKPIAIRNRLKFSLRVVQFYRGAVNRGRARLCPSTKYSAFLEKRWGFGGRKYTEADVSAFSREKKFFPSPDSSFLFRNGG